MKTPTARRFGTTASPHRTTAHSSSTALDDSAGSLRRPAVAFILAGSIWILGDIAEVMGFSFGRGVSAPLMLLDQLVFDVAIVSYVIGLLSSSRRGLAGGSRLGRVGLVTAAVCFVYIMVATTLAAVGLPQLAATLVVVGPLRSIAELVAGVGVLLGGAGRLPGRAVFFVYAVAMLLPVIADHVLPNSGEGPGFIYEVGQSILWIILGISLRRSISGRRGVGSFVWAVLIAAIVVAGIAVPH